MCGTCYQCFLSGCDNDSNLFRVLHIKSWLIKEPDVFNVNDVKQPIILWWREFGFEGIKTCGQYQCLVTNNREVQSHPLLKAVLFYGSSIIFDDLPIPRLKHVQWALLHEESPRNNPAFVYENFLNLFNHSSTFSRYSDVTAMQVPGIAELTTTKFFVPFEKKELLMSQDDLAPLLYIQSNCQATNDRDDYVSELMKYIRVDSYGDCLNNRKMPDSLKEEPLEKLFEDEFYNFVARYKFTLAFENADCDDYITEKLWRPLIVGSIPVYHGSPSFKDWLPNEKAAISVRDFDHPEELAEFIKKISNNQTLYDQYVTHKLLDKFLSLTNDRLLSLYEKKPNGLDFRENLSEFECHVCKAISTMNGSTKHIVTRKQLNCPPQKSALTREVNPKNNWVELWAIGKCEAKLLVHHVINNININKTVFDEEIARMYLNKEC